MYSPVGLQPVGWPSLVSSSDFVAFGNFFHFSTNLYSFHIFQGCKICIYNFTLSYPVISASLGGQEGLSCCSPGCGSQLSRRKSQRWTRLSSATASSILRTSNVSHQFCQTILKTSQNTRQYYAKLMYSMGFVRSHF